MCGLLAPDLAAHSGQNICWPDAAGGAFLLSGTGHGAANTRCRPAYKMCRCRARACACAKAHGGHGMQVYGFMPARGRYSKPLMFRAPRQNAAFRAARAGDRYMERIVLYGIDTSYRHRGRKIRKGLWAVPRSFPRVEQRSAAAQTMALKDKDYHFGPCVDGGVFAGLLLTGRHPRRRRRLQGGGLCMRAFLSCLSCGHGLAAALRFARHGKDYSEDPPEDAIAVAEGLTSAGPLGDPAALPAPIPGNRATRWW